MQIKFENGSIFTLKNMRHVPKLTRILIIARKLDDLGYTYNFGDSSWKLVKGYLFVAYGSKSSTVYTLPYPRP